MKKFEVGQKYEVALKTWARFGEVVGMCEIVGADLITEDQLEWKNTSIKDCFEAKAGTVTVVLHTATNNDKPKKFEVHASRNSEEFAKEYNTGLEYVWFCPGKRNYMTISAK